MRQKLRWLINHKPENLFIRAAKKFEELLEERLPGKYEIEIIRKREFKDRFKEFLTDRDYEILSKKPPELNGLEGSRPTEKHKTFADASQRWNIIFDALQRGCVEFTQTPVSSLAGKLDRNLFAIDLPFIFEDHDHVTAAIEGEAGRLLTESFESKTKFKALSFTYSGGYRIIGSTNEIKCIDELTDTQFVTLTPPSLNLFKNAGVGGVQRSRLTVEEVADMTKNGGSIETTYLRYQGKNVLKTDHSMFMTIITTNTEFFEQLPSEEREIFSQVAKEVATVEREWSVEDAEKYEKDAVKNGVTINTISDEDKFRLREAAKSILTAESLVNMGIDPKLLEAIKKAKVFN